jgi:hypothetical protein
VEHKNVPFDGCPGQDHGCGVVDPEVNEPPDEAMSRFGGPHLPLTNEIEIESYIDELEDQCEEE